MESPEKQVESKESPEKQVERKEAAKELDAATETPLEMLESQADIKVSEAVQEAFKATVLPVDEDSSDAGAQAASDPRSSGGGGETSSGLLSDNETDQSSEGDAESANIVESDPDESADNQTSPGEKQTVDDISNLTASAGEVPSDTSEEKTWSLDQAESEFVDAVQEFEKSADEKEDSTEGLIRQIAASELQVDSPLIDFTGIVADGEKSAASDAIGPDGVDVDSLMSVTAQVERGTAKGGETDRTADVKLTEDAISSPIIPGGAVVTGAISGGRRGGDTEESNDSTDVSSELPPKPTRDDFTTTYTDKDGKTVTTFDQAGYDAAKDWWDDLYEAAKMEEEYQESAEKMDSDNETKNDLREQASELKDELTDWPDGETREITVTSWQEGEDGTRIKHETTVTLTKDEAEALLEKMEEGLEDSDSRGSSERTESPFHLMEGSLLVGEAAVIQLPPDRSELLEDLAIDRDQNGSEVLGDQIPENEGEINESDTNQEEIREFNIYANNLTETANAISEQISILENIEASLIFDYSAVSLTVNFAEKQSDGTYELVPKLMGLRKGEIPALVQSMEITLEAIVVELNEIVDEFMMQHPDQETSLAILGMLQKFEATLQKMKSGKLDDLMDARNEAEDAGPF